MVKRVSLSRDDLQRLPKVEEPLSSDSFSAPPVLPPSAKSRGSALSGLEVRGLRGSGTVFQQDVRNA